MKQKVLGLLLGAALCGATQAHAVLIDNFDTPQGPLTVNAGTPVMMNTVTGPGIIGGSRTLNLVRNASAGTLGATAEVTDLTPPFGGTVLDFSNSSTVDATIRVIWGGNYGPSGVNLGSPTDWLVFRVEDIDHDLNVTVKLTDTDGDVGSNTYVKVLPGNVGANPAVVGPIGPVNPGPLNGVPGNYYHLLDLFVHGGTDPVTGLPFGGNTALNLDHIAQIELDVKTNGGALDVDISCIYTGSKPSGLSGLNFDGTVDGAAAACTSPVPEPSSVLLLGTGLLGAGFAGMRVRVARRRKQA